MKNLASLALVILLVGKVHGQAGYWQQQLQYTIDVSLNDKDHTLNGFLKLRYKNQSPDTLSFIWFHLWPNAYKNDRTAFSEQLLENGRTDFYFSSKEQKGYINRLDFRSDNMTLKTEDHLQYIDVVKVYLQQPLAPGAETEITTPFHVKLPYSFSRGGHVAQSYYITQWYPKPAVYDKSGWHPMPYLDQGEFYGEFASYDVRITLPNNYVVAATGELQNEEEKKWLQRRGDPPVRKKVKVPFGQPKPKQPVINPTDITSSKQTKTLQYKQEQVHDFAWFADKYFGVQYDTVALPSGKIIDAYSFYTYNERENWKNSIGMIKDALRFRSRLIGDYPYKTVSVVQNQMGFTGGMEYPTITSITHLPDARTLDLIIEHEIGHNWFYAALASNERQHPWLDEGLNTYYDNRYEEWKYGGSKWTKAESGIAKKLPANQELLYTNTIAAEKKDQPVITSSADFTELNYGTIAYYKTAFLLQELEKKMGRERFDSCMQTYYRDWKFKHPKPDDFLAVLNEFADGHDKEFRSAIRDSGTILPAITGRKKIKPALFFNLHETEKYSYINFLPAVFGNKYDKFSVGALVHNYNLPPDPFRFIVAPMYATGSKKLIGIGDFRYAFFPKQNFQKISAGLGIARFSSMKGIDSNNNKITGGFLKISPSLRFVLKNATMRSNKETWFEWKTYFIGEQAFDYVQKSADSLFYPAEGESKWRYLNQLTFSATNYRELYPYDIQLQIQQGEGFYRASITANYFLNYGNGGGAGARFFAAKFGYLGEKTVEKEFNTSVYQPKLTGVRGNEDYTYSNMFYGRNESDGFASQQIMMRDGGLKIRTDLFQGLQGRSDDWIAAINLNTSLPGLPRSFPVKLFFDAGTYAEGWQDEAPTGRFLYVGGIQLSFFKELLNIYAPLFYSKEIRDNLKTVPEENKFFHRISFSFDVHRITFRRTISNKIPL